MELICIIRGELRFSALTWTDKMPDNTVILAQDLFNLRSFSSQLFRSIFAEMPEASSVGADNYIRRPGLCDCDQGYFIRITTSSIRCLNYSLLNIRQSLGDIINHRFL